jgi:uncharacterized protein (TIGR02246 family)
MEVKMLKSAAIAAVGLLALAACQKPADPASELDAVAAVNKSWGEQFTAGNADAIAALYTEDAIVLAPGAPAIEGRDAIRAFFEADIAASRSAGLTTTLADESRIDMSGDVAWQTGTFTVADANGTTVDTGKYLSVLCKKNGKWMLMRDTWNSDRPPTPAPAAAPAADAAAAPAA